MPKNIRIVKCPICRKGHIADIPQGVRFKTYDASLVPHDVLKKVIILKCPKEAHYVALEFI